MKGRIKKIYRELFFPMYRRVRWFPHPCSYSSKSYSFKHKYIISNMGLVGYNLVLHVTCNAPGSAHDVRLLCLPKVFSEIQFGRAILQQYLDIGERLGQLPLVTIRNTTFPPFAWLLKAFPESKDQKSSH